MVVENTMEVAGSVGRLEEAGSEVWKTVRGGKGVTTGNQAHSDGFERLELNHNI